MTGVRFASSRLLGLLAAVTIVIGVGAAAASVAPTQSAWTDSTYISAAASAGTWQSPTSTSCSAWDQNGASVPCTVSKITFSSWQESNTKRVREYNLAFTAPNAKKITFSVDLTTGTRQSGAVESPAWSWKNASVGSDAQFTGINGWTCASLPLVTGQAKDWHSSVYFQVFENSWRTGMCS